MIPDRTVSGKVTFDEVFSTRSEIRNDRTGTTDQNSSVVFVGCAVAGTVAASVPARRTTNRARQAGVRIRPDLEPTARNA
jgi:hypothetical protein